MSTRKSDRSRLPRPVPAVVHERIEPPLLIVLGLPGQVTRAVEELNKPDITCWQLDRFPAEIIARNVGEKDKVVKTADLWDLPTPYQTVLYLPERAGERELKIDMIEQAYHVLPPQGQLLVWSPTPVDPFFPTQLKKIFGKVSQHPMKADSVYACRREGDRERRRHEVTFHARIHEGDALHFVSRPGVFAYGRFDMGARALMEAVELHPGERVLDLGCGSGTNGVFAWKTVGPDGHITFADSNARATALAELNAQQNGVSNFDLLTATNTTALAEKSYDVVLANPPYFAQGTIARAFLEQAKRLLKPGGRCYLVTKSPHEMATIVEEVFGSVEAIMNRDYVILTSVQPS